MDLMPAGAGFSKPHPLRAEKKLPHPAVSAALGMALSFYSYPFLVSRGLYFVLGFLFLPALAVIIIRVFRYLPGTILQVFGKLGILTAALAAGFSLGIAARRTVIGQAELGFRAEEISAVSGTLHQDPRSLQSGSGLGLLELRETVTPGGLRSSARGQITVFFPGESIESLKEFGRGCEIYMDGSFYSSSQPGANRLSSFRASSVHIVKPAPALEAFRTFLRQTLLEKFQNLKSANLPTWGSLASALLLGVRDDLDMDLSESFRKAGCTHILALSGMHLAIISGVLAFFLRRPFGIRWASLIGAVFIIFYIFVAGSQPSLVRAGIMYLIGAIAVWGLLKPQPLSLLCMAFIIQIVFMSASGITLSFTLSYLALLGILTLGESIRALFKGRLPSFFGKDVVAAGLSASLGAFVFTSPVLALYFDSLRPIGILAGLVIAPFISLFMVLSLAALAAGFLPLPVWKLFDFILSWFYRFLELFFSFAGRFPGIHVSNPYPVLIFSLLFMALVLILQKLDSLHRDNIASFD